MNKYQKLIIKNLFAVTLLFGFGSAWSIPVTWTLNGVVIEELPYNNPENDLYYGAEVTGSFVYEADTNTYSDISLFFEGGISPWIIDWTYTDSDTVLAASSSGLTMTTAYSSFFCGGFLDLCRRELNLAYTSPLTNSGGTVIFDTSGSLDNMISASAGGVGERYFVSGSLIGVAVPIPAAVWLFASGLGLLGWIRRRKVA